MASESALQAQRARVEQLRETMMKSLALQSRPSVFIREQDVLTHRDGELFYQDIQLTNSAPLNAATARLDWAMEDE